LDEPTEIDQQSVISANHYELFNPPKVVKENPILQQQNREQLARTEKLK